MFSQSKLDELQKVLPEKLPDMGDPEEHFTDATDSPGGFLFAGCGLVVFALAAIAGAIFIQPDIPDQKPIMQGILGAVALACLGGAGYAFYMWSQTSGQRFSSGKHWLVCTHGLIYLNDGKAKAYPWDQIEVWLNVVVTEVTIGTHHTYTLRAGPKRKNIPLPPARGISQTDAKLMQAIQRKQAQTLVPQYFQKLITGEAVVIGLFTLTKETLAVTSPGRNTTWKWKSVRGFEYKYDMSRGTILVQISGSPSAGIHLSDAMPNLWLFNETVSAIAPHVGETVAKPHRYLL
jgi:hypothetical protein